MQWSGIDWKKVLTIDGIKGILKGCGQAILIQVDLASDLVVSTQTYREEFGCKNCDLRTSDNHCNSSKVGVAVTDFWYGSEQRMAGITYKGCGCELFCKQSNLDQSCPLGKWLKVSVPQTVNS